MANSAPIRFWLLLAALTLFIAGASVSAFAQSETGRIWVHSREPGSEPGPHADLMPLPTDWTVELIIDASGSMNTPFRKGETRIEVAKRVFEKVVAEDLPENLPVALRVFGHEGGCHTELVMPRKRYPKRELIGTIHRLEAEGNTALGHSIELAGEDLKGVRGPKIVLLVTDGEETCGGDPLAGIRKLVEEVGNVYVHIIGYAIADNALKKQFKEWAKEGHGRYYDATHAEKLDQAIREALKVPYKVIDHEGRVYATGFVDGAPVEVPPGEYQLRLALEGDVIEHVTVDAGRLTAYSIRRTRERLEEFRDNAGEAGGIWVHSTGSEPGRHTRPMPLPTDWTVEMIIDASGSMNTPFRKGETRIEVAKRVFEKVIAEDLPENLPVALRVFGHKGGCHTELLMPRKPYPKRELIGTIHKLEAEGNTALGHSIELAGEDLKGVRGPKIVLLVTDGEETCGGNPLAGIRKLVHEIGNVHVNIVGYAIDDNALKKQFEEWAREGHGQYFDAAHAEKLDQAIREALKIPYKVVDHKGGVYATGVVDGAPVEVPPGEYRIHLALEGDVIEHVTVDAGRLASYSIRRTRERLEEFRDRGAGSNTCERAARESRLSDQLGGDAAALCRYAESAEPIHCLEGVWRHREDWGVFHEQIHAENEQWELALRLCRGSVDANRTIECFFQIAQGEIFEEIAHQIAEGLPWPEVISDINDVCNNRQ